MSKEVRSVSIEPSARVEEAPGWVVQNRPARYLARIRYGCRAQKKAHMVFKCNFCEVEKRSKIAELPNCSSGTINLYGRVTHQLLQLVFAEIKLRGLLLAPLGSEGVVDIVPHIFRIRYKPTPSAQEK